MIRRHMIHRQRQFRIGWRATWLAVLLALSVVTIAADVSAQRRRPGVSYADWRKARTLWNQAHLAYRRGDYEEAIRAADQVLASHPDRVQVLYIRAQANVGAGRPAEALVDAEHMLELNPDDTQGALIRVAALIDLDRPDEAEAAHFRLKDLSADSPNRELAARTCGLWADFYARLDKVEEAEGAFDECLAAHPTNQLVIDWAATFYVKTKQPDRAVEIWQHAVDELPEDFSLRKKLADLLRQVDRRDEAEAVLTDAAELFDTVVTWQAVSAHFMGSGDYTKAREAVERAMERSATNPGALRFALADLLILEGDLERAKKIANEISEPAYQNLLLGNIKLSEGDAQGALKIFESGLRLWPNNAGARYQAGRAAEGLGDFTRAMAEYRESVRIDQTATDAALHLALIHFSMGEYAAAAQFAQRHITFRPFQDAEAHMVRARSLAAMEKSAEAMVVLEELRRRDPESVAPFVELAAIRRNVDGPEAAHDIIVRSKMDLTQPDNVAGLQSIASDLVALDRAGEAMKRIDAAIAVSPDSAIHHQLRARVLARTKRADEARESVARALELDAELPQALELMSVLEQRDGNLDSAVAYAERAAAADPENADYAYTAAQLFRLRGDDDKALEILREAVKRDPGHAAACNDLAFGLATNGRDLYQALDLAERAVRVQRGADTLDTLGWVQLKRGDAAAADATFRKALELRPESPSIQYHLGLALIEGGDKDQGADLLRKAISGDGFPEAEQARQELARLEG